MSRGGRGEKEGFDAPVTMWTISEGREREGGLMRGREKRERRQGGREEWSWESAVLLPFTFSHLADGLIQSDLQ